MKGTRWWCSKSIFGYTVVLKTTWAKHTLLCASEERKSNHLTRILTHRKPHNSVDTENRGAAGNILTKKQSLSNVVLVQCWAPCYLRLENILMQNKKCIQPVLKNKVCTYMWNTTRLKTALNFPYLFIQNKNCRRSKYQNFPHLYIF